MNKKQQQELDKKISYITALVVSRVKAAKGFGITTCCIIDGEFILVSDYDIYDHGGFIVDLLEKHAMMLEHVSTMPERLPRELKTVVAEIHATDYVKSQISHDVVFHNGSDWIYADDGMILEDSQKVVRWKYLSEVFS